MSRVSRKINATGSRKSRAAAARGASKRTKAPRTAKPVPATQHAAAAPIKGPRTVSELMSHALTMELDAAQRYADLADAMDTHNNRDVAALFRRMAHIESKHAAQIMAAMAWRQAPAAAAPRPLWEGFEAPETTPGDEVHYLMQPYHALQLALENEHRAERFFARLARIATVPSVRKAARALHAEERAHVALVKAWLEKTAKPDRYWAEDPDPARYTD